MKSRESSSSPSVTSFGRRRSRKPISFKTIGALVSSKVSPTQRKMASASRNRWGQVVMIGPVPDTGPSAVCWYCLREQTPPFLLHFAFALKGQSFPVIASRSYSSFPRRNRSPAVRDSNPTPYHSPMEYLLLTFGFFGFAMRLDYQDLEQNGNLPAEIIGYRN